MPNTSNLFRVTCSLLWIMLAAPALAQPRTIDEGHAYQRIEPPLATDTGTERIEILDVFWYGCPVCAEFAPMMTYWGGEIRGDLVMRRMPAIWNEVMRLHAQLYFTAGALKLEPQVHQAAFRLIHEQHEPLNSEAAIRDMFERLGVAAEDFAAAWQSPEVVAAVQRAEQETRAAGIDRVPALIVNGRYRVERNDSLRELPELVIAVNELIKRERDLRRQD